MGVLALTLYALFLSKMNNVYAGAPLGKALFFDKANQSLNQSIHPTAHPSIHPSIHNNDVILNLISSFQTQSFLSLGKKPIHTTIRR